MRIGIGAILGVVGGPATYVRELVGALVRIDTVNEYVVLADVPERLGTQAPNLRCVHAPLAASALQPLWDHLVVPAAVRRFGIDLYHGTKGTLPLWCPGPSVVTIHDLAVYHQPETFAWLQRVHQRSHTPLAVRRAARVLTVSAHGRQDVLAQFRVPPDRVVAIPLAASPLFTAQATPEDASIAARLGLPARYVLYAGTIQPRKNVEQVVEAFAGVPEHGTAELLIAGRVRPGYRPGFLTHPPPQVRYLGAVSDQVLAVLYRRALALCSPSGYEGFGLSLLEAMRSGCLVIAGRNSAVPELVGDGGILLDELGVPAVRAALRRVLADDPSLAAVRAQALARAAHYTWDETAHRTLAVYHDVMETTRGAG
jgi:glycosyltransferase involved in cell wall biosynthesis